MKREMFPVLISITIFIACQTAPSKRTSTLPIEPQVFSPTQEPMPSTPTDELPIQTPRNEGRDKTMNPLLIPSQNPPTLDGIHAPSEWDSAAVELFADGSQLFLMQDGEFLYVGIQAIQTGMIAGNVFIQHGDEIKILHSSAALGTAIYKKDTDRWQQTQDFTWHCRTTSNSESAQDERAEFLAEEGWLAANGWMGTPNELEYQIKIPDGDFRLAAVYIKATPPYEEIPWPPQLRDDTVNHPPGGFPDSFYFSSAQWAMLDLSK